MQATITEEREMKTIAIALTIAFLSTGCGPLWTTGPQWSWTKFCYQSTAVPGTCVGDHTPQRRVKAIILLE